MKTNPKTEEEINACRLMPQGDYDFLVKEASDEVSKAGNEMIKLKLTVWDKEGREHTIFDYLLASMDFKLRHFCEATDLLVQYQSDCLEASDCANKSGSVTIGIQKAKDGYPDKNFVVDYVKPADTGFKDSPMPEFEDVPM